MKLRIASAILLISVLLCSCTKMTEPPSKSNVDDNITYETPNTDGINGVYIITEKGPVPVSYTKNGKMSLSGDIYYYNLKNILENDEAVKQKTFTHFDENGCNIGSKTYTDFQNSTKEPYKTLALSGNWRLCPPLRRIEYSEKDKIPEEYKNYFMSAFANQLTQESLKITDVWETDLDSDGTNEAVIKAKGEGYVAIVLMSETMGNSVLHSHFKQDADYDAFPFFADLDGGGVPSIMLLSGNSLKTLCVYKEKSATVCYCVYLPIV